jgi:hypothetical protein
MKKQDALMTKDQKRDARRFLRLLEKEEHTELTENERKFMLAWNQHRTFTMIRDANGKKRYADPGRYEGARVYHESQRLIRVMEPDAKRGRKQLTHNRVIARQGGEGTAACTNAEIIGAFKRHKSASMMQGITHAVNEVTDHLGYANPSALWKRVRVIASPKRPSDWYKTL